MQLQTVQAYKLLLWRSFALRIIPSALTPLDVTTGASGFHSRLHCDFIKLFSWLMS